MRPGCAEKFFGALRHMTYSSQAAGNSARMGFDKLSTAPSLHSLDTLLSRAVSAARGQPFVVALPAESHPYHQSRRAVLRPHDDFITVEDSDLGISAPFKSLARHALDKDYDALAVIMTDMPFITTSHLETLVILFETFGGTRIVRAQCQSGREGYPVIFPASVLPEFEALSGEEGVQVWSNAMARNGSRCPRRRLVGM
ncbi:NTP transferase domain-containing protein [uncultured Celeribacter sp.]|uniref:nucleotidyltransferase family protein n=1 Tax=uncultured Celeribacter sp. TaxID=1303376 RepID=UPI002AA8EDA1|nr:NTP transferase domain-containing protein [uncultured Celeribacter sp.]